MTPPTWRDLGRRASRLGVTLNHGNHTASIGRNDAREFYLESWFTRKIDARILRTAVAAALEQLGGGKAMKEQPTHAFVGYDSTGTPVEILVDDGKRATHREAAKYVAAGGKVERMTIEDALKVRMFERPVTR